MLPSRVFYILCGACTEVALLAAAIHNLIVVPAFIVGMILYHYAEILRRNEKE